MDQQDINKLLTRIYRLADSIQGYSGAGVQTIHLDDGVTRRYKFQGCKSPQELREELESLAIWMWSLKDYLKSRLGQLGSNPQNVEDYVTRSQYLSLCADIANSAKHGELRDSRSGRYAHISHVSISNRTGFKDSPAPTEEADTYLTPDDPQTVEYKTPVVDNNDSYIGDAIAILLAGMEEWEGFFKANPDVMKAD